MRRRPEDLAERRFDVLIVGGGVLGAFSAWDAALRGLEVALVEQGDFAGGTSANSLKIVHGGARYLVRGDLARMRASMAERSVWLRIAPHLVEPFPVLVPFEGPPGTRPLLGAAVRASEWASRDRNVDVPDDRRIPPSRLLDRARCLTLFPELEATRVGGGILFQDGLMYSSERLVLELVTAASEAGAVVANRIRCEGPLVEGGRRAGVLARDLVAGDEERHAETLPIRARVVVNAAGSGADAVTEAILGRGVTARSVPSLALNLVTDGTSLGVAGDASRSAALAFSAGGGLTGRRLLLVPWRGRTLIGTAHFPWEPGTERPELSARASGASRGPAASRPLGIEPGHPAVRRFLEDFNRSWPGKPLEEDEILLVHAGLLPARSAGRPGEPVALLRRPIVAVHGEDGGTPVVQGETVKFTTARRVAEELVDRACWIVGHGSARSRTAVTPLPGAPAGQTAVLAAAARAELAGTLPEDVVDHLVRTYGRRYRAVIDPYRGSPGWDRRVQPDAPVIRAQLLHGAVAEMALTREDLLLRRTELGARGGVTEDAYREAEEVVARARPAAGGAGPTRSEHVGPSSAPGPEALLGTTTAGAAGDRPGEPHRAETPASFETWLVDGHAHFHPCFGRERFLAATVRNLSRAAAAQREPIAAGCLLLAGGAWDRTVEDLEAGRELPAGWRSEPTDEEGSVILRRGEGLPLVFVRGRQLVSAEGVEVLALCRAGPAPDGRPLEEILEAIRAGQGVAVLPWGFGKWTGRRGEIVGRVLEELRSGSPGGNDGRSVFLGDNGIRPEIWPVHPHLRVALEDGVPVLPGSDPLPFERHAERSGSFGFRLTGALDLARPAGSVRRTLAALAGSPPPFGERAGLAEFVRSQVAMQRLKRAASAAEGGR